MILGPALNDGDFEIRWRAIGGVSMFANNVPIGGAGPAAGDWPYRTENTLRLSVFDRNLVQKDEQHDLEFWRRWWDENRVAIANFVAAEASSLNQ
jgi:hypothetical protein